MKCSCGNELKTSKRHLIQYYLQGNKTHTFECECGKKYDARIFLNVELFVDGMDHEVVLEEEIKKEKE